MNYSSGPEACLETIAGRSCLPKKARTVVLRSELPSLVRYVMGFGLKIISEFDEKGRSEENALSSFLFDPMGNLNGDFQNSLQIDIFIRKRWIYFSEKGNGIERSILAFSVAQSIKKETS